MNKISDKDNTRQEYKKWIIDVYERSRDMLAQCPVDQTFLELSDDEKIQVLLNSDVHLQARLLSYIQEYERPDILESLKKAQSERLNRWIERRVQRNKRIETFVNSFREYGLDEAFKMVQKASIMECAEMLACLDKNDRRAFLDSFSEDKSNEIQNRIKYVTRKRQQREESVTSAGTQCKLTKIYKKCLSEQAEWIVTQNDDRREELKAKVLNYQWEQLKGKIEKKDLSLRLEWKYSFINVDKELRKDIFTKCSESDKAELLSLLDQKSRQELLSHYNDSTRSRLNGLAEGYSRQRFLDNIYKFSGANVDLSKTAKGYISKETFEKWMLAESLPDSLEVLVAISMIEEKTLLFEKNGQSLFSQESITEKNDRYKRVCEKIRMYHHREFVPRSLEEALLVQVIRGIYALFEIPAVLNYFHEEYAEDEENLTQSMVSDIAAEMKSDIIEHGLLSVENKSDMERIMENNKRVFLVDRRTVGTRLRREFKENHGYPFQYGLKVFSPDNNFETRVTKKAQYDRFYQRDYLLSTLIPMRYSFDQINKYLKSDGLVVVSSDPGDPENIMVRYGIYVDEQKLADELLSYDGVMPEGGTIAGILKKLRYQYVRSVPMKTRVGYLCVLAEYLKDCSKDMLLPADHYINYFFRDNGNSKRMAAQVVEKSKGPGFDLFAGKTKFMSELEKLVLTEKEINKLSPDEATRLNEDFEAFKGRFQEYYDIPSHKLPDNIDEEMSEMAGKIRFFAAISFSIMTGQQYDGFLRNNPELKTAYKELSDYDKNLGEYLLAIWEYFLHQMKKVDIYDNFFKSPPQKAGGPNGLRRLELTNIESIQHKVFDIWKKHQ